MNANISNIDLRDAMTMRTIPAFATTNEEILTRLRMFAEGLLDMSGCVTPFFQMFFHSGSRWGDSDDLGMIILDMRSLITVIEKQLPQSCEWSDESKKDLFAGVCRSLTAATMPDVVVHVAEAWVVRGNAGDPIPTSGLEAITGCVEALIYHGERPGDVGNFFVADIFERDDMGRPRPPTHSAIENIGLCDGRFASFYPRRATH
jgi:hypothetical protein